MAQNDLWAYGTVAAEYPPGPERGGTRGSGSPRQQVTNSWWCRVPTVSKFSNSNITLTSINNKLLETFFCMTNKVEPSFN